VSNSVSVCAELKPHTALGVAPLRYAVVAQAFAVYVAVTSVTVPVR